MSRSVWREPPEESDGIYPGLSVCDNRVSGSIVIDHGRLPLWAFIGTAIREGWGEVEAGWSPTESYGFTEADLARFLYDLLEQRGEFGRLVLLLAAVERSDGDTDCWWIDVPAQRERMAEQLRRCLALVES